MMRSSNGSIKPIDNTNTETQRDYLLSALKIKSLSTIEIRNLGILAPASRIKDLRGEGHQIITSRKLEIDNTGLSHKVGVYTLIKGGNHD